MNKARREALQENGDLDFLRGFCFRGGTDSEKKKHHRLRRKCLRLSKLQRQTSEGRTEEGVEGVADLGGGVDVRGNAACTAP